MNKLEWRNVVIFELVGRGWTYAQIAQKLRITKGAVAGACHRAGVKAPENPAAEKPVGRACPRPRPRMTPPMKRKPARPQPPQPTVTEPLRLPLEELEPHQCRWPTSNFPPHVFCGRARRKIKTGEGVKVSPYCDEHHRAAYQPVHK